MSMKKFDTKSLIFLFTISVLILSIMASKGYDEKNASIKSMAHDARWNVKNINEHNEAYILKNYLPDIHLTGCISLDHYDIKDKKILVTGSSPPAWDWRHATYKNVTGDWTTPIRYQGSCGSCWDFAAMGALESIINIRAKNPNLDIDLSEQYLLSCPPNLEIKRPQKHCIYLFNEKRGNIPIGTIIMGNVTISASAEDKISGLDRIELYIDNRLVNVSKQLEWNWQDGGLGFHTLEIKAFDMVGNEANDKMVVFTWM